MNRKAIGTALCMAIALTCVPWAQGRAATPPPSAANATLDRAEALLKQGKDKEALAVLDPFIAADPHNAQAFVDRGDAYQDLGNDKAAIADYDAAIGINPEYAYAYASRCQSRRNLDDNPGATADCNKAIALEPDWAYPYRERALVEIETDAYAAALTDAQRAVKLDDKSENNLAALCDAYFWVDRYADALPNCNAALALDANSVMAHFYRGRMEINQKQWPEAIADFSNVVEHEDSSNGYYWRALARVRSGDYASGLADANRYIEANADDGDGYLLRGQADLALGKTADAKTAATDALRHYRIANDDDGVARAQHLLDQIEAAGKA